MRGAATKAMSDIVEERQQRRYAPFAAAPLRAAARRLAGFVARSSHTAPGIARRSRLASGPGGLQQNVKLFLREPLGLEVDLEPELHPPGLVELGLDAPEIGIIDIAAAGIESRPIEQVEQLPAEVDPARFGEAERLRQGVVLP